MQFLCILDACSETTASPKFPINGHNGLKRHTLPLLSLSQKHNSDLQIVLTLKKFQVQRPLMDISILFSLCHSKLEDLCCKSMSSNSQTLTFLQVYSINCTTITILNRVGSLLRFPQETPKLHDGMHYYYHKS